MPYDVTFTDDGSAWSVDSIFDRLQQIWAQTNPPAGYHYDPALGRLVPDVGAFPAGSSGTLLLVAVVVIAVVLLRK